MPKCITDLHNSLYNSPKIVPRICTPAVNTDNQIFREGNLFQRSVKGSFAQGYASGIKARIEIYD